MFIKTFLTNQQLAILPVNLLTICSGMHLAYGIFNTNLALSSWFYDFSIPAIAMIPISFHITSLIGGLVGCIMYTKIDIFKLHLISSTIMLIASIIFTVSPNSNLYIVLSARIFAGLAYGMSYNSGLIYASEISSSTNRSTIVFTLHISLIIGMILQSIYQLFDILIAIGITSIVLIIASVIISHFKLKNSHIYEMMNARDGISSYLHFQNHQIDSKYGDLKAHVTKESQRSFSLCNLTNTRSFCVIFIVTLGYISIFNATHNYIRLIFMKSFLMQYAEIVALASRLIGSLTLIFVIERIHKKIQFSIASIIIAILLSSYGSIMILISFTYFVPMTFFVIIEFLLGFGLSGANEILKSEIFALKEKPYLIAFICCIHELIQIAFIIFIYSYGLGLGANPIFWPFVFAPLTFFCGIAGIFMIRDTRKLTLIEASKVYE